MRKVKRILKFSLILSSFVVFNGCAQLASIASNNTKIDPNKVKNDKSQKVTAEASNKEQKKKKMVLERLVCDKNTGIKISFGKVMCTSPNCKKSNASNNLANINTNNPLAAMMGLQYLYKQAGVQSFDSIATGMKDMLVSSLQKSNCFKIIDIEALKQVQEQLKELGVQPKTSKVEKADYLIIMTITNVNYEKEKSGLTHGLFKELDNLVSTTREKANLSITIRIVSTETGEIVFSKTYKSSTGKTKVGVELIEDIKGFGGNLSGLSGTALETVTKDVIVKASKDIIKFLAKDEAKLYKEPTEKKAKTVKPVEATEGKQS